MVYPFLISGLIILVRSRNPGRDRAALIDALVITIGVGVLSWVFLMAPNASNTDFTLSQKLTSIAYPLGDLLLGGMIVRLAVGRGAGRRPSTCWSAASSRCCSPTRSTPTSW